MEIAANHHWITTFCKRIQIRNFNNDETHTPHPQGLYIEAFANGVYQVLGDYRSEIVKLENSLLQHPQLPLTYVFSCLEKYQRLFSVLKSIIQVIQEDSIYGCLLMGRLHKYIYCGVDIVANAAEKYKITCIIMS